MLKIYGVKTSSNVQKVLWCCGELGLAFQREEIGGAFGNNRSPAYLALNPNGLVPTIDEDGFILWESNVIVRYLCARHSTGRLYPEPLAERFDAERWMDWQQTTLNPVSAGAFRQWVRTPAAQRQAEVIAHSVQSTEPLFALLDAHLATRAYMLGDRFTMADIPVGCEAHRWFGLPQTEYTRPSWPHVERWFADLRSRPGARGVLDLALE